MEDPGRTEETEDIAKANTTPTVELEDYGGPSATAKQMVEGGNGFKEAKTKDPYKPNQGNLSENGSDLYGQASKGDTRAGAAAPGAQETIKVVNGQYWHRHPGYLSGAKTLSDATWHPAKQRHRGKNNQDITEKLHVAGGLGRDGLLGAPRMGYMEALSGDLRSGGLGVSLVGALADLAMSTLERQTSVVFNLAGAMLKGDPLSVSSGIIGQAVNAYGGIIDDMDKARERYRIPENVADSALANTIMGRAFKREKERYEKAYTAEVSASDDMLDIAVDKSIGMANGKSFFDEYSQGISYTPGDDYAAYLGRLASAKKAWLSDPAHNNMVDGEDYDLKRRDAVQQMNEDTLLMYSEGLRARGDDMVRAMDDLISRGKVHRIDDHGRIDWSASTDVKDLKGSQVDEYKERLQLGQTLTSEQLQTVADRTKGLQRRMRTELADKRRHDAEVRRQTKELYDNRLRQIREHGTMAEVAVTEVGGNVRVDSRHDPLAKNQLEAASKKLVDLITGNESRRQNALNDGVTNAAEMRRRYLVFDQTELSEAKATLDRWQDKIEFLKRTGKQLTADAEGRALGNIGATDRIREKQFIGAKLKKRTGIPFTRDGCNKFTNILRDEIVNWADASPDSHPDREALAEAKVDSYIADIASATGKDAADIRKALFNNPEHSALYEGLNDLARTEVSNAESDDLFHTYADYANTMNVSKAQGLLYQMNLDFNGRKGTVVNGGKGRPSSALSPAEFESCMRVLQDQVNRMADGCKASTKQGVLYDMERVDTLNKNINMLRHAMNTGKSISPGSFETPAVPFENVDANRAKDYLVDSIVDRINDPKSTFFDPPNPGDFMLRNLFGGKADSASQRRTMDESIAMMGLRGGLNRQVDESNEVNRFMAMLGAYTGGRRNPDPFSYSARNGEDRQNMLRALQVEMSAYDAYRQDHPTDTALSYAMESHMQYLTEKMAIADIRAKGGMDDIKKGVLDEYEADLDKAIRRDLVNLTTAGATPDRDRELERIRGGYLGDPVLAGSYADAANDDQRALSLSLTYYEGYNRDVKDVARAIGTDISAMFADESEYLVSRQEMDGFLGMAGNAGMSRTDILDATGFDVDAPMDHMIIHSLKTAGVRSLVDLENMSEAELGSLYNVMERQKKGYLGNRDLSAKQQEVLARSCIVAQDMVRLYASRRYAWEAINQRAPAWYTASGQSFSHDKLRDSYNDSFREVFANVKRTRWKFDSWDSLRRQANRNKDKLEFSKEDANALAAVSLYCAAYGIPPSGGQGVPNKTQAQINKTQFIQSVLGAGSQAKNIFRIVGDMDDRLEANVAAADVIDPKDPSKNHHFSEHNIVMTFSGGLNAYALGTNSNVDEAVVPINLYRMYKDIAMHGATDRSSRVDRILDRFNDERTGVDMDLENLKSMYDVKNGEIVDAIALVNCSTVTDDDGNVLHDNEDLFILPIVQDKNGKRRVFTTPEYELRYGTVAPKALGNAKTGALATTLDDAGMNGLTGKSRQTYSKVIPKTVTPTRKSASSPRPWSEDSIAKAECPYPALYLLNGRKTMQDAYDLDMVGGRIIENMPYVAGAKGDDTYVMTNRTADAVIFRKSGKVTYVSRRFGDIDCKRFSQTLNGANVTVTMPWEHIRTVPLCLFFGLLDVYVPWAADGFEDPRVQAEAAKTTATFDEAANAAAMIRDFGGFDDSPDIEADPVSRRIRNLLMRAYAKVGAYGKTVFDLARSKAQALPRITLDSYYDVLAAAYPLARDITLGPCTSHGAWHLVKGIRSNALLALSANPYMVYRKRYASSRPEVDAIAYIGSEQGKEEREMHVKDMMMLVGLVSACEQQALWPLIPRFYEDPSPEWKDAADYWYIMLHHPSPRGPSEEVDVSVEKTQDNDEIVPNAEE